MPGKMVCPPAQTLEQFLLGLTPTAEAVEIIRHLETCSHCVETLRSLRPTDRLIVTVRAARPITETRPPNVVEQLIQALRQPEARRNVAGDQPPIGETPQTELPLSPELAPAPAPTDAAPVALVPRDKLRVQSVEEYCRLLTRSKLITADGVSELSQRWCAEAGPNGGDLDRFTRWLVERDYLTRYQASVLLRGHADHFYLDQYKILDRIGEGRMAGVYKAVHQLGQMVAIKVLPPSRIKDAESFGRFRREARLAMQLKHPNTVRTFQVGVAGGGRIHYLIMEYLEGETLEELLKRRKRLPPAEAARLVYQALVGLQHIHEQGMVHRDLKPANLMLAGPPDAAAQATVKLLDIGLGRAFFDRDASGGPNVLTSEDTAFGTPAYMSPEQARNSHTVDIRADIYSLGCVLFEALAGQSPFPDEKPFRQMVRHTTEPPPRLRGLNPEVPDELQRVVDMMLAKDPAQRFPTPERAALALQGFFTRSEPPRPVQVDPRMISFLEWLESSEAEGQVVLAPSFGPGQPVESFPAWSTPLAPVPQTTTSPTWTAESRAAGSFLTIFLVGAVAGVLSLCVVLGAGWLLLRVLRH